MVCLAALLHDCISRVAPLKPLESEAAQADDGRAAQDDSSSTKWRRRRPDDLDSGSFRHDAGASAWGSAGRPDIPDTDSDAAAAAAATSCCILVSDSRGSARRWGDYYPNLEAELEEQMFQMHALNVRSHCQAVRHPRVRRCLPLSLLLRDRQLRLWRMRQFSMLRKLQLALRIADALPRHQRVLPDALDLHLQETD